MKRRSYILIALLLICAVVAYILYPTDRKRIRNVIVSCEDAIIREDIDGFMKNISFNYTDDYGGSYMSLKKRMEAVFRRLDDIEIERDPMEIKINEDSAEAGITVRVIASEGGSRGYIIGDALNARGIKIYLDRSTYKWEVIRVDGVAGRDT
jgi:hypothetical protein